jgi:cyanate permease
MVFTIAVIVFALSFVVARIIGPRIGGVLYDRYHNYQAAFCTAAVLAGVALLCELGARRPVVSGE